jgi:hypothetical protein
VFEVATINYLESPIAIGDNIHSAVEYLGDDQVGTTLGYHSPSDPQLV